MLRDGVMHGHLNDTTFMFYFLHFLVWSVVAVVFPNQYNYALYRLIIAYHLQIKKFRYSVKTVLEKQIVCFAKSSISANQSVLCIEKKKKHLSHICNTEL